MITLSIGDKVMYQGHVTRVIERIGESALYRVAWDNEQGEQQRKNLFAKHIFPLEDGSGYEHKHPTYEEMKSAHEEATRASLTTPEGQLDYYQDTAAEMYGQLQAVELREQLYKAALERILVARSITAMIEIAQNALQKGAFS